VELCSHVGPYVARTVSARPTLNSLRTDSVRVARPATNSRSRSAASITGSWLVHRVGNEAAWWSDAGVDSVKVARKLWKHIRVNEDVIRPGRFEPPLQNELWNQIFRCWRKRRSDSLTHLGACDELSHHHRPPADA
jgi:hypothetical protein